MSDMDCSPGDAEKPRIIGGVAQTSRGHSPEAQQHCDEARDVMQMLMDSIANAKADRAVSDGA